MGRSRGSTRRTALGWCISSGSTNRMGRSITGTGRASWIKLRNSAPFGRVVRRCAQRSPQFFQERIDARAGCAADGEDLAVGQISHQLFKRVAVHGEIELVGGDDFALLGELRAEGLELAAD